MAARKLRFSSFIKPFSKFPINQNTCELSVRDSIQRISGLFHRNISQEPSNKSVESDVIKISGNCVERLKELGYKNKEFLRVYVDGGGCSGFQYKFDVDSELADEDRVFSKDGVQVVVDETSLSFIKGSTIDYHEALMRSAFRIVNNPVAAKGCSCGASFSVKI